MKNYDVPLDKKVPVPKAPRSDEEKRRSREFGEHLVRKFYARYSQEHGVPHPQNWPKHVAIMAAFAERYSKERSEDLVDFLFDHHHGIFGPKKQRQGVELFASNCDWLVRDLVASMVEARQASDRPSAYDGIMTAAQAFGDG